MHSTAAATGALLAGCSLATKRARLVAGLSGAFQKDFRLGTSVKNHTLDTTDAPLLSLIAQEFNAITADNAMKWDALQPALKVFNWQRADQFVEFGRRHDMRIVGHVLVWHKQTPESVFRNHLDESDTPAFASRTQLLGRMEDHIGTVVDRYRADITEWDVVNEAIEGGKWLKSHWYNIIGPEYVQYAFQFARDANPNATLIYNDYGVTNPKKQDAILDLLKRVKKSGVKVDGVGMQCHLSLEDGYPSTKMIEQAIVRFAREGYQVFITELDVDVLPRAWQHVRQPPLQPLHIDEFTASEIRALDPYAANFPDPVSEQLGDRYASVFDVFMRHADKIPRVTLWGTSDSESWKNNWPILGRTNYPLLFDHARKPKKAYFRVLDVAQRQ